MADDPFRHVLRLVAEGRLTVEEAGPILDALEARRPPSPPEPPAAPPPGGSVRPGAPRFARIEVVEGGRSAVDLRVPLSLGRHALAAIPGLSAAHASDLDEAVSRGLSGRIVDISDESGDGVRIALE